ncbi:coatomer subunit delta-like [Amphibalanus amphitrite]|uniref:coatomer subunit delta-like n=1 Tax=Amphibalanus amphitrite TaxID=1232801 RepID=UPI001C90D289|nr:coatomer subunit delta-like [Amphibalanus amphitrite]
MVLLAAAVTTRSGKAILSRQFIEMPKPRIEGLLAAFPKLMSAGKQHTFVETDSVRYVYQPLDQLYVLLITTKASNILEDLDTLRLFTRVVPEYCGSMTESDVFDNAFSLIFAFDEIVALGYKESVNLSQVRTFVEMDSHEEKVYQAVRQTQEREAKQKMREKAKELQRQKYEAQKRGVSSMSYSGGSSGGSINVMPQVGDTASTYSEPRRPAPAPARPTGPSRALKLGKKARDADSFVDQLQSEGEQVAPRAPAGGPAAARAAPAVPVSSEPVALLVAEKLTLVAPRDGGLQNLELHGQMTLRITDESLARLQVQVVNNDTRGLQTQTHPQVDKDAFRGQSTIRLKNVQKPFPVNTDVGVLRWRYQTTDESAIPLSINCWPSENGSGGCDVNIEYSLEDKNMELSDVVISVPLVRGTGDPVIAECDGTYTHDSRRPALLWNIPIVDGDNASGSMEFSAGGTPGDFFPVTVSFTSQKSMADIRVTGVTSVDTNEAIKHSVNVSLFPEKYEIV